MLSFSESDQAYLEELAPYVAIPSVSRDADADTMRRAADWVADQLSFAGGRVEETGGHPAVQAEWLGARGAPTVLVYGHYDVQPTGSLTEWSSPPFELTREGEVVRARGISDDKGPVYIALKTALAFLRQEGGLPLNLRFLIEGEEEIGSPHLPDYVRRRAAELACDLVISADGAMWRPSEPSISLGSKGLVGVTVEVEGAREDLHSGRYGGTVANPAAALAAILAGLHSPDGSVAVAGFYQGVPALPRERRSEIALVPFDEAEYARELGVAEVAGEAGYSTLERLWERPTLEVNGFEAGGRYTVIPHLARAYVSCRLVAGQDPLHIADAVRDRVLELAPPGVRVEVHHDPGPVPAYSLTPDHPAVGAARRALEAVYPGVGVLLVKIGGSVPATTLFEDVLGAKTLFFSFSTSDERLHAPNEFLRVRRLREGMRAWERLLRELPEALSEDDLQGSPAAGVTGP